MQRAALRDRAAKACRRNPRSFTRVLHEGLVWRPVGSHDDGKPRHAFSPDQAHLDPANPSIRDNRDETAFGEIDVVDRSPGRFKPLAQRKINPGQIRLQQSKIVR